MPAKNYVPELSGDGWVKETMMVVDYLLQDAFLSDYSQTHIYPDHVFSVAWIIQQHHNNVSELTQVMRTRLATYFSRYFYNVEAEVTYVEDPDDDSRVDLTLFLQFTDTANKQFNLSKSLEVVDMKVKKIFATMKG